MGRETGFIPDFETHSSIQNQAALVRLSQLQDNRFEQAYMDEGGVNAQLENAAIFQREAAFGQNPDLVVLETGDCLLLGSTLILPVPSQITNFPRLHGDII
ncbi:hypothetical protein WKK05_10770 [Nostoc sp. UHCC 0302]|uniref:hypothetical protein n=1 Tax=Nostoc sp. UHCC 0302 TaxID=3134896 RepID=UPI00311CA622